MSFKNTVLIIFFTLTLISSKVSAETEKECFEKVSRAFFDFNMGVDKAVLKPVAELYNKLPKAVRIGTNNFTSNIATLLSVPNYILQGELQSAVDATASFGINTTIGILGFGNPAAKLGFEVQKEDVGQTLGSYGVGAGCYFVMPILGPTTTRDAIGLVGNVFLDPVYQITHNTEISNSVVGNDNYSEHNYYYYRGTDSVDFRAKNIESFDLIIDDGSHNLSDILIGFNTLFKYLTKKGIYIIEDFKHPNYYKYNRNIDHILIDKMYDNFENKKFFNSNIISKNDQIYFFENIKKIENFKGNLEDSDISFIEKN